MYKVCTCVQIHVNYEVFSIIQFSGCVKMVVFVVDCCIRMFVFIPSRFLEAAESGEIGKNGIFTIEEASTKLGTAYENLNNQSIICAHCVVICMDYTYVRMYK